jgi:hypothetical protein
MPSGFCHSCHPNAEFMTRGQLADAFKRMGAAVPDLAWEVVRRKRSPERMM